MECCPGTQDSWSVRGLSSQFTPVESGYDPIHSHSHRSFGETSPESEPPTLPPTTCHSSCRATIRGPSIRSPMKYRKNSTNMYKMMLPDIMSLTNHLLLTMERLTLLFRVTLRRQPPSNGTDRASQIGGFPTNILGTTIWLRCCDCCWLQKRSPCWLAPTGSKDQTNPVPTGCLSFNDTMLFVSWTKVHQLLRSFRLIYSISYSKMM